jgi:FkbM family methyltransferase
MFNNIRMLQGVQCFLNKMTNCAIIIYMMIVEKQRSYVGGSNSSLNGEIFFWNWLQKNTSLHIIFDVGIANSSYIVDNSVHIDNRQFYCVEADSYYIDDLKKRYNNRPDVTVLNYALGNNEGEIVPLRRNSASIFYRKQLSNRSNEIHSHVMIRKLDLICDELKVDSISFLKLDVEGYEFEILKGGLKIIESCPFIQFEYGGTSLDAGISIANLFSIMNGRFFYAIESDCLNFIRHIPSDDYKYTNYLASKLKL